MRLLHLHFPLRVAIVVTIFVGWLSCAHSGEPTLRQRFLSEGPKGWKKLASAIRQIQGTETETYYSVDKKGKKPIYRRTFKFKVNAPFLVFEEMRLDQKQKSASGGLAAGANSKYYFLLRKNDSSGSWFLNNTGTKLPKTARGHPYFHAHWIGFLGQFEMAWSIAGMPLPMMIDESGFKIRNITQAKRNGKDLVKLEFSYAPPADYKPAMVKGRLVKLTPHDTPMRGGWVIMDPDLCWAISECEVTLPGGGKGTAQLRYENASNGLPVVRTATRQSLGHDGTGSMQVFNVEKLDVVSLPESDFTLTAFGLPEPQGVVWETGSNWHLWILGAAAVSLLLGAFFGSRWLRRSKAKTNGPASNPS